MLVVADTSALNYLVLLGRTELLPVLYGKVVIPHAVRDEMLVWAAPAVVRVWATELPDWLNVVSALRIDATLSGHLGAGEREAISLALELTADVLLMDDQPARAAAEERGLIVSGTLSVLLQGARAGLFEFEPEIERLKGLGFRVSKKVEERMLQLAGRSE